MSAFKAYDIRGRVGEDLTEEIAYALGRAAAARDPGRVATGRDIRESSAALQGALNEGLADGGADVSDIGLCGTEEVYFATDHLGAGMGIMVTASHNPIDYNGMKLVGAGSRPLDDATFRALEAATLAGPGGTKAPARGRVETVDTRAAYVERVVSFVDPAALPAVKLVANPGNGCAGPTFDAILDAIVAKGARVEAVRMHHAPDGGFPNGIPNPLLPENQPVTADRVREASADLGLAWDGDFDRCFFFDETGAFIPGEYMVALLAQAVLAGEPGAKIVHDPRVAWNTIRTVREMGGEPVVSRTGHALVKAKMRETGAAYGGEMSAHHYFRDFMCCDSGMIPWLLVLAAMAGPAGQGGSSLGALVGEMRERHPSSGEINFRVEGAAEIMAAIEAEYRPDALSVDHLDGLSMEFADWRFNLRRSNTEPLLRLNVETRGDRDLLERRVADLRARIAG
ncbi:phosphomannomutase [Rhodobacterales bacterium HKCCE2091]|nr:phosphomannomutase [Rhodobacterales bacterium HKCCE2091]